MPYGFSKYYQLDRIKHVEWMLGSMFQFHSNFESTFYKQTLKPRSAYVPQKVR